MTFDKKDVEVIYLILRTNAPNINQQELHTNDEIYELLSLTTIYHYLEAVKLLDDNSRVLDLKEIKELLIKLTEVKHE
jgi:hypothetical protein